MDTNDLRKCIKDNDIINRAIHGFWDSFINFMDDDWTENNPFSLFNKDKLIIDIKEISMKLRDYSKLSQSGTSEVIEVRLDLHYLGSFMGYYSISYDFSGKEVDNELIWGLLFASTNHRLSLLEDLRSEFDCNTVTDILDSKGIEVITNIIDDKIREMKKCFK